MTLKNKKFAILLSGCGHLDGAEISEAVLTMLHIDQLDIKYDVFSINDNQKEVVDHVCNHNMIQSRNMMVESARISRQIHDIKTLNPQKYDALLIPGGMGVAKNFSNLSELNSNFQVRQEIAQIITEFASLEKPIGAICIAPVIVARVLKNIGCNPIVTLGDSSILLQNLDVQQKLCSADEIVVDFTNKIVSTPAYMLDARISEISTGISKLILKVQELC